MSHSGRLVFFALSILFVLAVLWQTLIAGFALFRSSEVWDLHMGTGHLVMAIPFLMVVLAFALRLERKTRWYAGLLLLGTVLQAEVFAAIRESVPIAAAFHPVLALLLFAGGALTVQHAWVLAHRPATGRAQVSMQCSPSPQGVAC